MLPHHSSREPAELAPRAVSATRLPAKRTPQNALLAGLLLCNSCRQPMVPTYTAKPGRRYRYYVCRSARQNGWSACPTKSVPARMIEESVLEQLRMAVTSPEACQRFDVDVSSQAFEANPSQLLRALVKQVSYDGTTGAVLLSLHAKEGTRED